MVNLNLAGMMSWWKLLKTLKLKGSFGLNFLYYAITDKLYDPKLVAMDKMLLLESKPVSKSSNLKSPYDT